MYVVTVEFEIHSDHIDAFREQMFMQAKNSLDFEEECRQFDVCFDPEDKAKCFLYEKYDDRSAFDAHLASQHFKQFDKTVCDWLKSKTVKCWQQA